MRVIQLLPVLSYGDAVSNDALAIHKLLLESGYDVHLVAERVLRVLSDVTPESLDFLNTIAPDDVAILHLSTGSEINKLFSQLACKRGIIFHNITPPYFFHKFNQRVEFDCKEGLKQAIFLAEYADWCIADSCYNKEILRTLGYACPIEIVPVLVPFEDYEAIPNADVIARYEGRPGANILFTGRVAPNKCQHDVIRVFASYKQNFDKDARLFIVGSFADVDPYGASLVSYVEELNLDDVHFLGHIGFDSILAYYSIADIFLCQSEHEGFCVPLLETMYFNVPILAYRSTAIPETLGDASILLDEKDPYETSVIIDYVMKHPEVRQELVKREKKRLQDFAYERVSSRLMEVLNTFLGGDNRG